MPILGDIVKELDSIFKPQSVAVIGASNSPMKWGYRMITRPIESGFRGRLYPINLKEETVAGLKSYPSVLKVPEDIDLAVIVVPAPSVPQVMEECVEKDVKGAVIISAGFAETGPEGAALQEEVTKIAEKGGIKFVGPNCNGIGNADVKFNLAMGGRLKSGEISFISQSGTFGVYLSTMAMQHGYGINKFVHMGNEASLTETEYLQYFAEDPNTKVIVCYIEGLRKGREFFETAKEIVKSKPIVLYKAGRTPAGAKAMLSHTASIAGADEIFEAACKQAGIIRVYEAFHPFILGEALVKQPLPKGNRVVVIGGGGGYCVSTSDACNSLGLTLPDFDEETQKKLRSVLLPHAATPRNPIDTAADNRPRTYERLLKIIVDLDYIDGIIMEAHMLGGFSRRMTSMFMPSASPSMADSFIKEITDIAAFVVSIPEKYGIPIIATGHGHAGNGREQTSVDDEITETARIPVFSTPEDCARAMYGLVKYAEIRKKARTLKE